MVEISINYSIGTGIFLIVLLSIPFTTADATAEFSPSPQNTASSPAVTATVFVQYPNFDVLSEKSEPVMTVIYHAEIPQSYEGSLIRLKSDDTAQLKKVLANLAINRVIVYEKDAALAQQLETAGFTVATNK